MRDDEVDLAAVIRAARASPWLRGSRCSCGAEADRYLLCGNCHSTQRVQTDRDAGAFAATATRTAIGKPRGKGATNLALAESIRLGKIRRKLAAAEKSKPKLRSFADF